MLTINKLTDIDLGDIFLVKYDQKLLMYCKHNKRITKHKF